MTRNSEIRRAVRCALLMSTVAAAGATSFQRLHKKRRQPSPKSKLSRSPAHASAVSTMKPPTGVRSG